MKRLLLAFCVIQVSLYADRALDLLTIDGDQEIEINKNKVAHPTKGSDIAAEAAALQI